MILKNVFLNQNLQQALQKEGGADKKDKDDKKEQPEEMDLD